MSVQGWIPEKLRLMVILLKSIEVLDSLLKAMYIAFIVTKYYSKLDFKAKASQFMHQNVEGFRDARFGHIFTFNDRFISFCPSLYIVRFNGKNFLQDVGSTKGFKCPDFHFTETLATELRFTAERLLRDE